MALWQIANGIVFIQIMKLSVPKYDPDLCTFPPRLSLFSLREGSKKDLLGYFASHKVNKNTANAKHLKEI